MVIFLKMTTSLTVDPVKFKAAQAMGINVSQVLDDALAAIVQSNSEDKEIEVLRQELMQVKKKRKDTQEKDKQIAFEEATLMNKISAKEQEIRKYEDEELAQKIIKAKAFRNADILNEMLDQ
jgi:hypothetical protein